MDDIYRELGFKQPDFVENLYGIKIYIGTSGQDDWCVEIPAELAKKKSEYYHFKTNLIYYLIPEHEALRIAKKYTELAKK